MAKVYATLRNDDPEHEYFNEDVIDTSTEQVKYYTQEKEELHTSLQSNSCIKNLFDKITDNFFFKFTSGLLFTILWIFFYFISLEGCDKQQAECLKYQTKETVSILGFRIFYSSLSFLALILFIWLRLTYRVFLWFSVTVMFYLFYIYDNGADFAHHGAYNRVFFYLFFFLKSFIIMTLYFLITIFRRHFIKSALIVIFIGVIVYRWVKCFVNNSCEDWDKGFKGSSINNDIGYCKIYKPRVRCFLYLTNNLFDLSALRGMSCKNDRNVEEERYLLKKYLNVEMSSAKKVGFPRTEHWEFFPDSTLENFNKNIFKGMIDMDKAEENEKKDVEVFIDFDSEKSSYPEVNINLKRNETLIKEREEIRERSDLTAPPFKNVIQIYIDALSRNHFRKKLRKTFKWLEQFYNEDSSLYSSYQFLKYHSLDFYTFANMIPGYFGTHKYEEYNTPYFLWQYKQNGFITGQSSNVCEREGWDLEMVFQPYLNYTNFDHEFNAFYCDPNFSDPDQPYQVLKGAYSVTRKCMYGRDSGEFQIDYAKQFFSTYRNQSKFYRMMFSDAHEGTMEVVKYLDDPIVNFLEFLKAEGHLEDSVLMIMSDHGTSMPGPAFLTQADDWFREVFLGALFYVIPKNHTQFENFNQNLKSNENVMVTSFDIHSSLLNFVNLSNTKTKYGSSLFSNQINDFYRTCLSYKIDPSYCICNLY